MTDGEFKKYIAGRYQEMLDFYDKRAVSNKKWFRGFSVYVIATSGLLAPIMTLDLGDWKYAVAFASASVAIVSGLLVFSKFQENWVRYRSAWDCLKKESSMHQANIEPYRGAPDRNSLFVERIEAVFAKEASEWLSKQSSDNAIKRAKHATTEVGERKY